MTEMGWNMSTPILPDDHTVVLELGLDDLKVVISALLCQANDQTATLGVLEDNARILDLLIQLERGVIHQMQHDLDEEKRVREFGEI